MNISFVPEQLSSLSQEDLSNIFYNFANWVGTHNLRNEYLFRYYSRKNKEVTIRTRMVKKNSTYYLVQFENIACSTTFKFSVEIEQLSDSKFYVNYLVQKLQGNQKQDRVSLEKWIFLKNKEMLKNKLENLV